MAQLTANRCGRIQAIVGPMFSGKTEELIRRLTREMFANKRVLVVKHCRDTRSAPDIITTHDKAGRLQMDLLTDTMGEVYEKAVGEGYDVVGIDEGHEARVDGRVLQKVHEATGLVGVLVAADRRGWCRM